MMGEIARDTRLAGTFGSMTALAHWLPFRRDHEEAAALGASHGRRWRLRPVGKETAGM
jgi:hypothetical protein